MTKRDITLVLVACLLFGLSFFFFNNKTDEKSTFALIVYKDEVLAKVDLSKDKEYGFGISRPDFKPVLLPADDFHREDYSAYNMISVEGGSIRVEEASCPDGLCSKVGPVSRRSDMIVCLPHKFYIKLEGSEEGGLDAISE